MPFPPGPRGPSNGCLCDCCVLPMQKVLQQLVGVQVLIETVADAPNTQPLLFLVKITSANDFIVTVTDGVKNFRVSIPDIIAVGLIAPGPPIILTPPVNSGCECDCRERPLRQLFNTLIGSEVDIRVNNGSMATNFNVEGTGLGIVIGSFVAEDSTSIRLAISLCQITNVNTPI